MSLRLALLLDHGVVNEATWEFLGWCDQAPGIEIVGVFLSPPETDQPNPQPRWLAHLERRLLRQKATRLNLRERHPLGIHPSRRLRRPVELKGPAADRLATVSQCRPDVVVYLGQADEPPLETPACSWGILAVQPLDDRKALAGFSPVRRQQDASRLAIRRFCDGYCEDLLSSSFATRYFYRWNAVELQLKGYTLLRLCLERLSAGQRPRGVAAAPTPALPSLTDWVAYVLGLGSRLAGKWLNRRLGRDVRWQVAYQPGDWTEADPATARLIPNPPGHFLADPFVFEHQGQHYCFVEDYDHALGRAGISVYALGDDGASPLGSALAEDFHLSFPHVFAAGDEIYLCPECADSGQIRLYRAVEFPLRWELAKVLKDDGRYADTLLFPSAGRWWMLTNRDAGGMGDFGSLLELYSSPELLSDQWTPHPDSPLQRDAACGRNGGLLRRGNTVFRVAQQQGFDFYGKSCEIREITCLDPETYREFPVQRRTADFAPGLAGTHHLFSNGSWTVFDLASRRDRTRL